MADNHQHGEMDISAHLKTWGGVVTLIKWSSIAVFGTTLVLMFWLG